MRFAKVTPPPLHNGSTCDKQFMLLCLNFTSCITKYIRTDKQHLSSAMPSLVVVYCLELFLWFYSLTALPVHAFLEVTDVREKKYWGQAWGEGESTKTFHIYCRLLTRHDVLPVWLVADKQLTWRRKTMYQTECGTAHPVLLNRLSKVNISCGLALQIFIY